MSDQSTPRKNQIFIIATSLLSQADNNIFQNLPTLAAGDARRNTFDGAVWSGWGNTTNAPAQNGERGVIITLTAAEMNNDIIHVVLRDAAGAEWQDQAWILQPSDDTPSVLSSEIGAVPGDTWDEARAGHVAGGSFGEGVASVVGSVGSVGAGGIAAAAFAANAVDANALAADAVDEIVDGAWDEPIAGHLIPGSTGAQLNAAGAAGDPWITPLPGAYAAGTAGNIVGNRLDAAISTVLDRIGQFAGGATNNIFGFLKAAMRRFAPLPSQVGGTYDPDDHSLEAIARSFPIGWPPGAIEYTYTVTDSTTGLPVEGVDVWVTTDIAGTNIIWRGSTDTFGVARDINNSRPWLDAGTFYFWTQRGGYSDGNPDVELVS